MVFVFLTEPLRCFCDEVHHLSEIFGLQSPDRSVVLGCRLYGMAQPDNTVLLQMMKCDVDSAIQSISSECNLATIHYQIMCSGH